MWIDGCNTQIKLGLERMLQFKKEWNQNFKVIHVGGTNGKGSVCHFISSVLSIRHRVGLYTSPHLERVNERIKINGREISNEEIEKYKWLEKYNFTYFEAITALALKYFEDERVDYGVIEVGMGGRYDATNIVEPFLTIITDVSLDHMQWLGESIEEIAKEKAGIIKNAPVVTACGGGALEVIKKMAEEKGVEVFVEGRDFSWKRDRNGFMINGEDEYFIKPKMNALYQGKNIAIAIKSLEILGIGKDEIIEGIEKVEVPARMERIGKFIIDGAHNPDGIRAFVESIKEMKIEPVIIFGAMKDKDIRKMLEMIPYEPIILTKARNERAMPPEKMAEFCQKCMIAENVEKAIEMADKIGEDVAIVGSLYLAGEARKHIMKKYRQSRKV